MELTVEKFNDIFSLGLEEHEIKRNYKQVYRTQSEDWDEEKDQGAEGRQVEVYDVGLGEYFLRIERANDSYADRMWVDNIKLVKQTTKTVQVYE